MNSATNIIDDLRLLEPWTPPPLWVWALLALAALALLAWAIQRRRAATASATADTDLAANAHEEALADLEKAKSLLAAENPQPYGIAVSGIIRRYIERRFALLAPRRSTEEFLLEAAASTRLEAAHRLLLADFLGACDFLKFARAHAELGELNTQHALAIRFVEETRVVPAGPGRHA